MRKKIKIIATLGPATDQEDILENMILAGMDIARLNMSHGSQAVHATRITALRNVSKRLNKHVDILIDLQGPKIRIGKFINHKINLQINNQLILDPDLDPDAGTNNVVYISDPHLYKDLNAKDILFLDDGKIELLVEYIRGNKIFCIAKNSGVLCNNKGINKRGGGLSASTLTTKDKEDILFTSQFNVNYFALSFVKTANDIHNIRQLIQYARSTAKVFAKIETKEATINIDQITQAADGVMVARGDLGVELGLTKLPSLQKRIIQVAKFLHKPSVVATQLMESMIENPIPTRAEVMDIANAVIDGASGIVFTAETATGKHPGLVIKYAHDICKEADQLN